MSDHEPLDDGGPAFPYSALTPRDDVGPGLHYSLYKDNEGMTLRDYFAGQIAIGLQLSGMVARVQIRLANASPKSDKQLQTVARIMAMIAYRTADAMLAERRRGESADGNA